MTNRITQLPFANLKLPRKIEDDQMFLGWSRVLPRLWYLDQRQASRLDAESLYGSKEFAAFYNRTQFTSLAEPVQVGEIGTFVFYRSEITDIGVALQSQTRTVTYIRSTTTVLPTLLQEGQHVRPSGGPVNPIVHPITGADQASIPVPFPSELDQMSGFFEPEE